MFAYSGSNKNSGGKSMQMENNFENLFAYARCQHD